MICVSMESVEKLIQLYVYLSRNVSEKQSRTARLIRTGNWRFAAKRLAEEREEVIQAYHGGHGNPQSKNPDLTELAAEMRLDQRLSDIVLETSQLSYWYLVYHLAKSSKDSPSENLPHKDPLDANVIASALQEGAQSTTAVTEHEQRIRENTTVETVYGFIGRILAEVGLPLDIFAELDLREMMRKPYLEDFRSAMQRGSYP